MKSERIVEEDGWDVVERGGEEKSAYLDYHQYQYIDTELMHQALLVSEILVEIFMHVDQIPSIGKNIVARKSLAALATTCKAFHDPAMDFLWATVDDLQPLLGCVTRLHPLIYCGSRAPGDDSWAEGIERLSSDETWEFLRHSDRIRSFNITSNRLCLLISIIPIEACVFPRLHSLTISTGSYFGLFMSPTLRHCSIFLERIKFSYESTGRMLFLLSSRVSSCNQLITLTCPPIDWAAWKDLSNLPTLVELKVDEVYDLDAPAWRLEPHLLNFSPFLYLTALSFQVETAEYMSILMEHSQFPSLKKFCIYIGFMSSPEAERLFRKLSHCKQTLEELEVVLFEYDSDDPQGIVTIVPHLLCFTQLRILQIECISSYLYLDNNLFLKAMSAWPHIHTLKMEDSGRRPSITFHGLFAALCQCPDLETLRVLIDTVNIDIDPNAEPIQHTSLRTLVLESVRGRVENAEVVAHIIFTWLPCVDQVNTDVDDWQPWEPVNTHLASLRAAAQRVTGAASNT
ncbi:hypothetical protein DEU56DRAFT_926316 [Suillus clintonianus]|uniref:uncharacterized protein n=1 Tax=Suillus clintonianus TaxID=1904413 RepID=UPI001B87CB72|nr:uncharacterized protein DEU56DRAFT_926316 [Suillus clintonianus]KAG2148768.1 hypothetical protein DEU56DRAFT_926316 [Suillus clintonianus]